MITFAGGGAGIYNQTPPTMTNGQLGPFQLMADGSLKVYNRLSTTSDQMLVGPIPGMVFLTSSNTNDGSGAPIGSYAPNGQTTNMMNASTVAGKVLTFVTAGTSISAGSTSADIDVSRFTEITFDFHSTGVSSGTSPTITVALNRKGADGTYYPIYTTGAVAGATPTTMSANIGRGYPTPQTSITATSYGSFCISIGATLQVVVTIGGSASPSVTCGYSIIAKM